MLSDVPKGRLVKKEGFRNLVVSEETIRQAPVIFANHVETAINLEEVSLTFCFRRDALGNNDSDIVDARCVVILTHAHALRLSKALADGVGQISKLLQEVVAGQGEVNPK